MNAVRPGEADRVEGDYAFAVDGHKRADCLRARSIVLAGPAAVLRREVGIAWGTDNHPQLRMGCHAGCDFRYKVSGARRRELR